MADGTNVEMGDFFQNDVCFRGQGPVRYIQDVENINSCFFSMVFCCNSCCFSCIPTWNLVVAHLVSESQYNMYNHPNQFLGIIYVLKSENICWLLGYPYRNPWSSSQHRGLSLDDLCECLPGACRALRFAVRFPIRGDFFLGKKFRDFPKNQRWDPPKGDNLTWLSFLGGFCMGSPNHWVLRSPDA